MWLFEWLHNPDIGNSNSAVDHSNFEEHGDLFFVGCGVVLLYDNKLVYFELSLVVDKRESLTDAVALSNIEVNRPRYWQQYRIDAILWTYIRAFMSEWFLSTPLHRWYRRTRITTDVNDHNELSKGKLCIEHR